MKTRGLELRMGFTGALLAAWVALAAGCSIPIPQAEKDPTRYFVLSAANAGGSGAGANAVTGAPAVLLREVELAPYLRARPIVVRRGEHEIEFREFARWGEPLELGVGRVLREDLLARGAASAVIVSGLRAGGARHDLELKVRVLAAEGGADGAVIFRAAWELAKSDVPADRLAHGNFTAQNLRWDGKSEAELAGQLSAAVAGLAGEIAGALKK